MSGRIPTLIVVVALAAAVGCSDSRPTGCQVVDCGDLPDSLDTMCDAFAQTGCLAGQKCSWIQDQGPFPQPTGHIQCVPDGTTEPGGACMFGEPGPAGYDDCIAGAVCVEATCHLICSATDIPCGDGEACEKYPLLQFDPYPLGICF